MIRADDDLRSALTAALDVRRWVDEVMAGAPYETVEDLLAAAGAAAHTLTPAEVDEALAQHPRIGQRAAGRGAHAEMSRREQSSADADDPALAEAIARGNRAYEERFGRIFLVRAGGRTRRQVLAELERRMANDDPTEVREIAGQLREIALLRLRTLMGAPPAREGRP